jgi:hypothetical protein
MDKIVPLSDKLPAARRQSDVEIFDPPMCCPTGVCGPTIDQTLLDVNEMTMTLQTLGVTVARYQMTNHPNAFLSNPDVMKLVREQQMDVLPITVVAGKVIKTHSYPTFEEVKQYLTGVS